MFKLLLGTVIAYILFLHVVLNYLNSHRIEVFNLMQQHQFVFYFFLQLTPLHIFLHLDGLLVKLKVLSPERRYRKSLLVLIL